MWFLALLSWYCHSTLKTTVGNIRWVSVLIWNYMWSVAVCWKIDLLNLHLKKELYKFNVLLKKTIDCMCLDDSFESLSAKPCREWVWGEGRHSTVVEVVPDFPVLSTCTLLHLSSFSTSTLTAPISVKSFQTCNCLCSYQTFPLFPRLKIIIFPSDL